MPNAPSAPAPAAFIDASVVAAGYSPVTDPQSSAGSDTRVRPAPNSGSFPFGPRSLAVDIKILRIASGSNEACAPAGMRISKHSQVVGREEQTGERVIRFAGAMIW